MPARVFLKPEPDPVYIELVTAMFDIEVLTWTGGLVFAALGVYLTVQTGDGVIALLTLGSTLLMIPRLLLLRAFRRARGAAGGRIPDPATAATWELRYSMGLILFAVFVGGLCLRTFAIADPYLQLLAVLMQFGFASGVIGRVSVRPLICTMALTLSAVPEILMILAHDAPHHHALAVGMLVFLVGGFGTMHHVYEAARRNITTAQDMAHFARNDPLTGLLNRHGLRDAFAAIAPDRTAPMVAVHYCDLDGFKPVNDRYGHPAGDAVLAAVAERLRCALRPTDLAARVGGDEFIVVQAPVAHAEEVDAFAARLALVFAAPHMVAGAPLRVDASIGSALAAADRPDLDQLLADSDRALYVAKQARHRNVRHAGSAA